ncbi:MAG TPA: hypothetical protein VFM82_00605 [Flavobacteriaceae bacterium]|nr:hypothetical protein [Flavobacteriaceae bacterium]
MRKKISILLTLLLLSNATGIGYGQHFCGGHLMKSMIAFGEAALDCGMEKIPAACDKENHAQASVHNDGCCQNQLHKVTTDDNLGGSQFQFDFDQHFIISKNTISNVFGFISTDLNPNTFNYLPPPLEKDIQVLYEVFLI